MTWYTNGKARKGLFYARSQDGGQTFSDPVPVGRPDRSPSRPFVIAGPHGTAMVWKEFDGEKTTVNLMTSADDGGSWSSAEDDRQHFGYLGSSRCWCPTAAGPIFPG